MPKIKLLLYTARGGSLGGAVAGVFANAGASVYLSGRHIESVQQVVG